MTWLIYLTHFRFPADFHAQVCDADAQPRSPPGRSEAPPVPAVSEVLQLQPPARPAHQSAHRRKTLQMFVLRPALQATLARPAAHATAHW